MQARTTKATRPTKTSSARSRRVRTIAALVDEFLMVHESEGHSRKTLEWHKTSLGFLVRFLQEQWATEPREFEIWTPV